MPKDPNTDKEVLCHVVELDPKSPEYQEVEQDFSSSLGAVGTLLLGKTLPYRGILKIQRIQNQKLYSQYIARKRFMDRSNPKGYQNEQRLFHGCSGNVTDDINHEGLNRSFAGKNGELCVWGYTVYSGTCVIRLLYNPEFSKNRRKSDSRSIFAYKMHWIIRNLSNLQSDGLLST